MYCALQVMRVNATLSKGKNKSDLLKVLTNYSKWNFKEEFDDEKAENMQKNGHKSQGCLEG